MNNDDERLSSQACRTSERPTKRRLDLIANSAMGNSAIPKSARHVHNATHWMALLDGCEDGCSTAVFEALESRLTISYLVPSPPDQTGIAAMNS